MYTPSQRNYTWWGSLIFWSSFSIIFSHELDVSDQKHFSLEVFLWVWEFLSALHAVFCSILAYVTWLRRHYVVLRHVKLDLLTVLTKCESSSPGQHVIVIHITKVGFCVGCNCEIYPWVSTLFALLHETGSFDIPSAWSAWDYWSLNLFGSRNIVCP